MVSGTGLNRDYIGSYEKITGVDITADVTGGWGQVYGIFWNTGENPSIGLSLHTTGIKTPPSPTGTIYYPKPAPLGSEVKLYFFITAINGIGDIISRSATATATITGDIISGVTVNDSGMGYYSAPTVEATGGGGSGAALTAQISGGSVTGVLVINPGSGYTSQPGIQFSVPPIMYELTTTETGTHRYLLTGTGVSGLNCEYYSAGKVLYNGPSGVLRPSGHLLHKESYSILPNYALPALEAGLEDYTYSSAPFVGGIYPSMLNDNLIDIDLEITWSGDCGSTLIDNC